MVMLTTGCDTNAHANTERKGGGGGGGGNTCQFKMIKRVAEGTLRPTFSFVPLTTMRFARVGTVIEEGGS